MKWFRYIIKNKKQVVPKSKTKSRPLFSSIFITCTKCIYFLFYILWSIKQKWRMVNVSVVVFLKNNKRGGLNKHGSKFYGFYHIFQIGIFWATFVNLVKIKVKSFKNSKVNAQKCKFFCKLFDAKRWIDGKLINVADQIRAWRTDFFCKINTHGATAIR